MAYLECYAQAGDLPDLIRFLLSETDVVMYSTRSTIRKDSNGVAVVLETGWSFGSQLACFEKSCLIDYYARKE